MKGLGALQRHQLPHPLAKILDPPLLTLPAQYHHEDQGPDLHNILQQSYDYLTIMPRLRSTYDGRLIYRTSYAGRTAFLRYDSLAKL